MTRLTASELREDLSTAINKVAFGGERIILQRNKKDVAALVSIEDLVLLRQLEDRADLAEIRKAMAEPGPDISWEDAKKELGL
jgi:PHD/YefM family antitoxin component YafN of YafNO toxin-antitoxin module